MVRYTCYRDKGLILTGTGAHDEALVQYAASRAGSQSSMYCGSRGSLGFHVGSGSGDTSIRGRLMVLVVEVMHLASCSGRRLWAEHRTNGPTTGSVNPTDDRGNTVLHAAVDGGMRRTMERLSHFLVHTERVDIHARGVYAQTVLEQT